MRGTRTILLWLSGILLAAALASVAFFGLELGIDFTGGSLLEAEYSGERPSMKEVRERLSGLELGTARVQPIGEKGVLLRMKPLDAAQHTAVLGALGEVRELRFESIGPVIGRELRESTLAMLGAAALTIVLYIALAFRRITEPLSSWQYSVAAFLPLLHDIVLPLGALALLGEFAGWEITIPVVVALLTVFGYSVNNTVVTFDRIRENLLLGAGFDFRDTVQKSVRQTLWRNLNASFTTLLVLGALFFFGGEVLSQFSLALIIGIAAGTSSSLVLGPSFLSLWARRASLTG